jgi:hypothetical protein
MFDRRVVRDCNRVIQNERPGKTVVVRRQCREDDNTAGEDDAPANQKRRRCGGGIFYHDLRFYTKVAKTAKAGICGKKAVNIQRCTPKPYQL